MNILVIGSRPRYDKYTPASACALYEKIVFHAAGTPDDALLASMPDADVLLADAISTVSRYLIERLPNLRLIHSEGVGYDKIDTTAADERGIFVCNNKGCNSAAVAEQAILLMLALLRSTISGDAGVREGRQMALKEQSMVRGITELGDCKVGIVGLGDIGTATAQRLRAFGCELYYYSLHRKSADVESALGITYLPLSELRAQCDIVSLHTAVTPDTIGLVNAQFLAEMKPSAYLINTARGEIVDNIALREALISGAIAGAGLDTIYPEPTTADNPVVDLPPEHRFKAVFSPHLGGITSGCFVRAHRNMWENVAKVSRGEVPVNIVNRAGAN